MGKASPAIAAFVGGEFSPQMEGRTDTEKYAVASHISQNFLPLKQGPAMFRPGTAFVQAAKNSANRTWLVPFMFSQAAGNSFLIEFGDKYCRFYANHGPLLTTGNAAWNNATSYVIGNQVVLSGITYYCILANTNQSPPNATYWYPMAPYNGSPTTAIYEIPSPYAVADLTDQFGEFTPQYAQQGDVVYIAGGDSGQGPAGVGYPPYTLTRFANAPPNWQFAQYSPTDGPYADPPPLVPGSEIALTVSAVQGNGITISSWGGNLFAPTDVGRLVRIGSGYFNVTPWTFNAAWTAGQSCSNNGNNYQALNSGTSLGSAPTHTAGAVYDGQGGVLWLYTDSGYGVAQITSYAAGNQVLANVLLRFPANVLWASGTPLTITGITQANPAVVSVTNTLTAQEAVFIYGVNGMVNVNQTPYVNQTASGSTVTLAGVDSTSFHTYTSGGSLIGNASVEWELGAWSNTTEWPRAVAFYKDRLFWGGKLNIWGSVPGLYTSQTPDFFGQQTTDSAMNELVSGADASNICWLSSAIILLIGTEGGEYGLDSANYSTSPLGPANVEILRQSQWRVRDIKPVMMGTTVLYVQRAARKVFAMDYNFYLNRYDSTDQSKFSYHITIGGLNAIALQQEPFAILWATRADGTLLSYTFNREDNVTAWARHNIGGSGVVESIAVINSPDGSRDELWMIVNRLINGAIVRTVEYMVKYYEGPQAGYTGDQQNSCWYVDCGLQYQAPVPYVITNAQFSLRNNFGSWSGTFVFFVTNANTLFTQGQQVSISGMLFSGTLNPNTVWTITAPPSSTTITCSFPSNPSATFAYISGGAISAGNNPSSGNTVVTGLPAVLWNQTVAIFADGGAQPQQTVSGAGTLTVPGTFNLVTFGFPYQGNLVPMRPEGGADVGTAQGKLKQGANLVLRLVDSQGGIVGQLSDTNATTQVYQNPLGLTSQNLANVEIINYNLTTTPLDSPPPIMSGDFPTSFPAQAASDSDHRDFYILVQQSLPYPMTVVGLYPSYKVEDSQ